MRAERCEQTIYLRKYASAIARVEITRGILFAFFVAIVFTSDMHTHKQEHQLSGLSGDTRISGSDFVS